MAKDIGAAEGSVRTYLKELETAALLEIEQRGLGKTNLYKLCLTIKAQGNADPDRSAYQKRGTPREARTIRNEIATMNKASQPVHRV